MGPGVSVLVNNKLDIKGTADKHVTILPLDPEGLPWGTFSVVLASDTSNVSYLTVSGGSEAWVDGIYLSGQLNFYSSDVNFDHLTVRNALADDGLNVKNAITNISNSTFEGNSSDAFDGDWVSAVIKNSVFTDNKGDGADFSGSLVVIRESILNSMGDKGVSAGENSKVTIYNSIIEDNEIGVASKDLSAVDVYASVLAQNGQAISLYQKKAIFGPGYAKVYGALVLDNETDFFVEKKSVLTLFGTGIASLPDSEGVIANNPKILTDEQIALARNYRDYKALSDAQRDTYGVGPKTPSVNVLGEQIPDLSSRSLWPTLQ